MKTIALPTMQLKCNKDLTSLSSKRLQFTLLERQSDDIRLFEVTTPLQLDENAFAGFVYAKLMRCWGAEKYALGLDYIPTGYIY